MPRITYHDRFAALLAKDYVSDRDRSFAESLYASYKRKRSLSAGRRQCFLQLEERYATRPEPAAGVDELDVLIARVSANDPGSWDERFAGSVRSQLLSGRALSERQTDILDKIRAKYSDEAMGVRDQWYTSWNDEKAESYRVVMEYYARSGYFKRQVSAWKSDNDLVPTMEDYTKVTDNKFAKKVLAGWHAAPKFPCGSMVSLGSGAGWSLRQKCPTGLAVVVGVNASVPSSAARGNKVYKLLPVGSTQTLLAEERQLKRARVPKKK